jgi:transcription elongation factor GreA
MSSDTHNEVFVTSEGLAKLKSEYDGLVKNKRKEVAERIASARELGESGDDNAEYEAAREEQSFVEGRIVELEELLKKAKVIDHTVGSKIIEVGSTVTVEIDEASETYTIVGSVESEPGEGKISHESPVGKALLGLKAGDEVEIETPTATLKYRIKRIS